MQHTAELVSYSIEQLEKIRDAAPDMLAALEEIIGAGHLVYSPDGDYVIEMVNAAIAKAKGK